MGYDIKSIRQDFKSKGIFYTPPELAMYMRGFLPEDVNEVYDPTCGNGGLLSAFDGTVEKYGQDINGDQVEAAAEHLANFHGVVGDTLKAPAFMGQKFRYIVANPPFSIKWEPVSDVRFDALPCLPPPGKADYAFLAHILHYLADDGTAVVLNFPGILYRGQREGKIRQWMVEQNYIDTVIHIEGNHFVDTSIATCLLILKKRRETTDIRFVNGDREHVATREEVAENGYQLSVSTYVVDEVVRPQIDPVEIETQARLAFLKRLRNELSFEKMVCDFEGLSMEPFLNDITVIVDSYRQPQCESMAAV